MAGSERAASSAGGRATGSASTRSASPAKRPASEMEGMEQGVEGSGLVDEQQQQQKATSGLAAEYDASARATEDTAMSGTAPANNDVDDSNEMDINSASNSSGDASSTNTAASSMASAPAVCRDSGEDHPKAAHKEPYTTEEIDTQVAHVEKLLAKPLDEGSKGVVISTKWLARVQSRSTQGKESRQYPKDAREGPVGPLDNSDITPENAYDEPLQDANGTAFIPLNPGLSMGQEILVLPYEAYGYIVGEYGTKQSKPIVRYAHNSAEADLATQNVIYENYPPILTIHKVPQPGEAGQKPEAVKSKSSLEELRRRKAEREGLAKYGQASFDDAIHLVASRSEKVQKFMIRAKEAAGIPRKTKVKVFRLLDSPNAVNQAPEDSPAGVPSPPASCPVSPTQETKVSTTKLILDPATFNKMKGGADLEPLNLQDNTNNPNYNGSMTLGLVQIFGDHTLVFEEQLGGPGGGEFPSDSRPNMKYVPLKATGSAATSGRTSPAPSAMMTRGRTLKNGRTRGTVGLSNLGNTCYMNSALQCIRSVEELAIFFLSKRYKAEINNDNPLGHHGKMANAYHSVIEGIYGGTANGSFSPQLFKRSLGTAQPMFSGWGQQDSQEFLSFLVDALHEDLNRIKKKPYIENPDSDDATVHQPKAIVELGETYRNNHKSRNDSVAMDLFSGFYKNKMECPTCDKVSITFDPYSLLTVQLPINVKKEHTVTFVPINGRPVRHRLDIDGNAPFKALMETIASKHDDVDANRMVMAEVFSHKIYKLFDANSTLADDNIAKNDYIFFWEVDGVPTNPVLPEKPYSTYMDNQGLKKLPADPMNSPMSDCFAVPIFHQTKNNRNGWDPVMHPLYITVTREEAKNYDIILKKILIAVSKMTSRPILKEFSADKDEEQGKEPAKGQDCVGADDAAGVSDHSNSSEDSYVNVEMGTPVTDITDSQVLAKGTRAMQIGEHDNAIPEGFMDPSYILSPALRSHLFDIFVGGGWDRKLHVGEPPRASDLQSMPARVKLPSRRSSVQSSDNSGESGSEVESAEQGDEEDEHSEPDIVMGGERSQPAVEDTDSDDVLHGGNTLKSPPQTGRGKKHKGRKGKKGRRANQKQQKREANQKRKEQSLYGNGISNNFAQQEDSPYYVQLGEGIVLNWRPEAFDGLFDGDAHDPNELRGSRTTNDDGTGCEIFPDPELDARRAAMQARQKNGVTLDECFIETCKREVLSEENAWYCNRCKEMRLAAKTLEIWTLPDILVVHLKRFGGARGSRDKIDVHVNYPINGLDMSDKVGLKEDGKDYIYDLFAVDNHYGGLGGGHYTAMAKNFNDGEWYDYNDSSVNKIGNEDRVHSAAAYLLFYRRRSEKPLGPQYLQELVTEYRKPKDSSNEDDSDSGEGRLGGPPRSQHGSSSASAGVGAGAMNNQHNSGSGGVGQGNSRTGTTETLSSAQDSGWSWSGIDTVGNVPNVDGSAEDDDAGSTTAHGDVEDGDSAFQGEDLPPYDESGWSSGDATWDGLSDDAPVLHINLNDNNAEHVEDTENDRITEIGHNASSSGHDADPDCGLD